MRNNTVPRFNKQRYHNYLATSSLYLDRNATEVVLSHYLARKIMHNRKSVIPQLEKTYFKRRHGQHGRNGVNTHRRPEQQRLRRLDEGHVQHLRLDYHRLLYSFTRCLDQRKAIKALQVNIDKSSFSLQVGFNLHCYSLHRQSRVKRHQGPEPQRHQPPGVGNIHPHRAVLHRQHRNPRTRL